MLRNVDISLCFLKTVHHIEGWDICGRLKTDKLWDGPFDADEEGSTAAWDDYFNSLIPE